MTEDYKAIIKFIKILSITALCCTVTLFAVLLGASATPGKQSGEFTDKVTGAVDSAWNLSEKVNTVTKVQSISLKYQKPDPYCFTGDTVQLNPVFLPSGAPKEEVEYSIADETLATVSADGVLTFLKKGRFDLVAKLASDESIKVRYTFECVGENPLKDDTVDKMTFSFSSPQKSSPLTLSAGESRMFCFNEGKTDPTIVDYTVEDESVASVFQGIVYGKAVGETRILATLTVREKTRSVYIPITVTEGEQPVISEIRLKDYVFTHRSVVEDYRELIDGSASLECFVISDNEEVISVKQNELHANKTGSATLTFIFVFDENVRAQKTFTVEPIKPTSIKIIGHDEITPGTYQYTANHYPKRYSSNVKWSVVSGRGTIDEKGNLTVKSYGKVVIRCQSTIDESLYVDKEINVKLYTGAYGFVRKFMGHGGLSALLGFGVFFVFYLFAKRKWLCVFSPVVTFAYACLSELIQYFTPGRYCLWSDVLIDFIGSLLGIAIAVLLLFTVFLVWKLISKSGYKKLRAVIKETNYSNIFKRKFAIDTTALEEITAVDDLTKNSR